MVYGCTKTVSMVISHTNENLALKARCCDEVKENVELITDHLAGFLKGFT